MKEEKLKCNMKGRIKKQIKQSKTNKQSKINKEEKFKKKHASSEE